MTWVAVAIGGGALLGAWSSNKASSAQASAADNAARVQQDTANQQVDWQREQFNRQNEMQAPWRQAGETALNRLATGLQSGGEFASSAQFRPNAQPFQFGMQQFQQDPGYSFRLSEGLKGLDRQAAARGGLISGAALKGAQRYGQEFASNEYQNAFNRASNEYQNTFNRDLTVFNTNRQTSGDQYNRLASLAGVGQTAVQQLGAAGQAMTSGMSSATGNYANQATEAYQNAAQARASGYMGISNAFGNAIGQGVNFYGQQQALNKMFPQQSTPMDFTGFQQQSYPAQAIDPFANIE